MPQNGRRGDALLTYADASAPWTRVTSQVLTLTSHSALCPPLDLDRIQRVRFYSQSELCFCMWWSFVLICVCVCLQDSSELGSRR